MARKPRFIFELCGGHNVSIKADNAESARERLLKYIREKEILSVTVKKEE